MTQPCFKITCLFLQCITFLWTKTSISYDQSNVIGSYRMPRLSIYDTAKLIIQCLRKVCFAIILFIYFTFFVAIVTATNFDRSI